MDTRPYWFWAPKSMFVPLRLIFVFLTPKSIFFLYSYRLITQQKRYWSTNSVFGVWRPIFTFSTLRSIYFFHLFKISDHMTILILGRKFRFWAFPLFRLFSPFWPLKVYIFLIYTKFPIDWWVSHTTSSIF
jgi:hypothetical protein